VRTVMCDIRDHWIQLRSLAQEHVRWTAEVSDLAN
jgi:hypothetical protein